MKSVHVCLVSEQPNPNLVPLIDQSMEVDEVILCHTQKTRPQAQWLQATLRDFQIGSELVELNAVNDIAVLRDQFQALFEERLQEGELRLVCNVTGGTKPMSLALFETAYLTEMDGSQAYYMDLNNTLSWLIPQDREMLQLQDRIKLSHFLKVRGFELAPSDAKDLRPTKPLCVWIAASVNRFTGALTQLNYLAMSARKNNQLRSEVVRGSEALDTLVDELVDYGLVQRSDGCLVFRDENARFFCNGGWLEEYVYHCLRELAAKKGIKDTLLSVEVIQDTVRNELDVMALVNNRVLMFECKTFKTDSSNEVNKSLYKLGELTNKIGGRTAQGVFVSLNEVKAVNRERAKQSNIKVIAGAQLATLKQTLDALLS